MVDLYHQAGGDPKKAPRHREIYLRMRKRREAGVKARLDCAIERSPYQEGSGPWIFVRDS